MLDEPFDTTLLFHRGPTLFGLLECSSGPRYHFLVVQHARSCVWVFTREEAETEQERMARVARLADHPHHR